MAWKETERAKAVKVRRHYRCTDCLFEFNWIHDSEFEDSPACPMCADAGADPKPSEWQVPMPALGTNKGRAVDLAQKVAEEDFGLTNFNDNQRAGDIAFKPPPVMQTAEKEAMTREMIEAGIPVKVTEEIANAAANFWQGGMGDASTGQTLGAPSVAAAASAAARKQGVDPVGMLQRGRESGVLRPTYTSAVSVKS